MLHVPPPCVVQQGRTAGCAAPGTLEVHVLPPLLLRCLPNARVPPLCCTSTYTQDVRVPLLCLSNEDDPVIDKELIRHAQVRLAATPTPNCQPPNLPNSQLPLGIPHCRVHT